MDYRSDPRAKVITTEEGQFRVIFPDSDSLWLFETETAAHAFKAETLARWDANALQTLRRDIEDKTALFLTGSARARAAALEWLRNQANTMVRRHVVGFAELTIDDLLNRAIEHGYRPTLRAGLDPELGILADLYDLIAKSKGMTVRAYRG